MFWGVIPDFLEGGKIPASAVGRDAALARSHTNDLRLPTAIQLNAPSGVRWNKWDGRGRWDGRKTQGGGLKGAEMAEEAGLLGDYICEGLSFSPGASKVSRFIFNAEKCGSLDESLSSGFCPNAGWRMMQLVVENSSAKLFSSNKSQSRWINNELCEANTDGNTCSVNLLPAFVKALQYCM